MSADRPHEGDPAGKGMRERLMLLAEAIDAGDARRIDDFSAEELWMLAKMWGAHDEGLENAMQTARELGLLLISPFHDEAEGFDEELLLVFPEFASR